MLDCGKICFALLHAPKIDVLSSIVLTQKSNPKRKVKFSWNLLLFDQLLLAYQFILKTKILEENPLRDLLGGICK